MSGSPENPFLGKLRARPKESKPDDVAQIDRVAEERGFVDRTPRRKPGRKASPRTFQLHPKVLPRCGMSVTREAERLGVTQGHLVEMMWAAYEREKGMARS